MIEIIALLRTKISNYSEYLSNWLLSYCSILSNSSIFFFAIPFPTLIFQSYHLIVMVLQSRLLLLWFVCAQFFQICCWITWLNVFKFKDDQRSYGSQRMVIEEGRWPEFLVEYEFIFVVIFIKIVFRMQRFLLYSVYLLVSITLQKYQLNSSIKHLVNNAWMPIYISTTTS